MASLTNNPPTVIHLCRDIEYYGGVEQVLYDLVRFEPVFRHVLIALEGTPKHRSEALQLHGITVHYITGTFISKVRRVQEIVRQYDHPVLHCHLFNSELIGVCVMGCRQKVTTKYCTYATDRHARRGLWGILRRHIDNILVDHILVAMFDKILVVSDELLRKWRFCGRKVILVPMNIIRRGQLANPRPHRILGDDLQLLAVGRMVHEKQFNLLADALREVRFGRLTLLGDGPQHASIKRRFMDLGIDNVDMPGQLPRSCVFDYMDASDALLIPSITEGLPLVAQEALARGLPVVAMDVGGLRSLISSETGVLVSECTATGFAKAVESLKGRNIGTMSCACIDKCRNICLFDESCQMLAETYMGTS